jgi:GH43 family beta-xylosidase
MIKVKKEGVLLSKIELEFENNGVLNPAVIRKGDSVPYALFSPEYDWERRGEVNNVVFTTGTVLFGDTLFIY